MIQRRINPFVSTLFVIAVAGIIFGVAMIGDASTSYYATAADQMVWGVALLSVGLSSGIAGFLVAAIGWYIRDQTRLQGALHVSLTRSMQEANDAQ